MTLRGIIRRTLHFYHNTSRSPFPKTCGGNNLSFSHFVVIRQGSFVPEIQQRQLAKISPFTCQLIAPTFPRKCMNTLPVSRKDSSTLSTILSPQMFSSLPVIQCYPLKFFDRRPMVLDAVGNSPMKVLFKAGNQEMRNGSWGSESPPKEEFRGWCGNG